jgi:hypothetical protein
MPTASTEPEFSRYHSFFSRDNISPKQLSAISSLIPTTHACRWDRGSVYNLLSNLTCDQAHSSAKDNMPTLSHDRPAPGHLANTKRLRIVQEVFFLLVQPLQLWKKRRNSFSLQSFLHRWPFCKFHHQLSVFGVPVCHFGPTRICPTVKDIQKNVHSGEVITHGM